MQARHRNYQLKDTKKSHAQVHVIPTGLIEIKIVGKKQCHAAEFEHLYFERAGKITNLIGKHTENGKAKQWQLPLADEDAKELEILIEEAAEELEILMRNLL